jgi:hypothetical protein
MPAGAGDATFEPRDVTGQVTDQDAPAAAAAGHPAELQAEFTGDFADIRRGRGHGAIVAAVVGPRVVFIVFLGLNGAGLVVLDQNIKNSQRDEAVSVAEMEMRAVRDIPFANLPVTDNTFTYTVPPRSIRGLNVGYTVTRTIRYLDAQNREVTILVSWNRLENKQIRTYSHREITIVRQK